MYTGQIVFSQLMDFLPRYEFNQCVSRYQGNYRLRKFSCLDQFLCMAFAQLTYRESLRDIQTCLRALQPKLYHAGIRGKVSRSTLADAVSDHRKTYFFGLSPTGHRSRQPRLWRGIGGNGSVQRLNRPQIEHRQRVGERRGAGELIVPPP